MKYAVIFVALSLLSGCGLQVDPNQKHTTQSCTDTRDGERFEFNTARVKNPTYVVSDICFTVIDNAGTVRNLCRSHEVFLKCVAK